MAKSNLLASPPYPWFGGKSSVADLVWARLGDVPNFVEPFFGGGAVWRMRPHWPFSMSPIRRETINDYDGHVANFWRAVQAEPEAVAGYLDWPVNELDVHARGDWLCCRPESREFVEQLRGDPDFYDAKFAGWWCWFVCNWIGGLPAVEKNSNRTEDSVHRQHPHLSDAGQGVARQLPHLGNAGRGVARQLPNLGNAGRGACAEQTASLREWMNTLADRLRGVRVCCGDWSRVCGRSVTWNNASPCGVFLDPPYSAAAGRDARLYSEDSLTVAHDVRAWALTEGARDDMRICLAGYAGEGHEELKSAGWDVVAWKAGGGYAKGSRDNLNCHKERLWFSPACLRPGGKRQAVLFAETEDGQE